MPDAPELTPIDPLEVRQDKIRGLLAIHNAALNRLTHIADMCVEIGSAADHILFETVTAQRKQLLAVLPLAKDLRRERVDAAMSGEASTPR